VRTRSMNLTGATDDCISNVILSGVRRSRTQSKDLRLFFDLSGHRFSPAIKVATSVMALPLAEKLGICKVRAFALKGTGFSPYIKSYKMSGALAPEGRFPSRLPYLHLASASFTPLRRDPYRTPGAPEAHA